MDALRHNEMVALMRWLSLGRGEDYAISAAVLEDSLVAGAATLQKLTDQPLVIDITGGALLPETLTTYRDDPLLPLWTRFAKAFPDVPCLGFYANGEFGPLALAGNENVFQTGRAMHQGVS